MTADRDALKELAAAAKTKGDFAEAAQSLEKPRRFVRVTATQQPPISGTSRRASI